VNLQASVFLDRRPIGFTKKPRSSWGYQFLQKSSKRKLQAKEWESLANHACKDPLSKLTLRQAKETHTDRQDSLEQNNSHGKSYKQQFSGTTNLLTSQILKEAFWFAFWYYR
jgi:uncharacterized cysteine cluster protein YcgN (CxxCxxCC family)